MLGLLILPALAAGAAAKTAAPDPSADVFGPTKLWTVRIHVTEEGWKMMQPSRMPRMAAFLGFGRGPTTKPTTNKTAVEGDVADVSPFGYQYAYVKATLQFDNETYRDVGLRFKGNSSYNYGSKGYKRPFKIDFNRFVDKQNFHGMPQLNLNNNAYDPSYLREAVSYQVYRDAGVPAPRTAFATVFLTIDGVCNDECIGLYTIVEELTKDFLKEKFGTAKGLLVKPEGFRALPYLGDEWKYYEAKLEPKTPPTPQTKRRLIEFFKFVQQADDAAFQKDIGKYLAVDEFLRYMAASVLLANLDSFLVTGHNFYMYVNPDNGLIYWIPWDLNLSLGSFGLMGSLEDRAQLSISRPYTAGIRLLDRIMAIEEYNKIYREHLRKFSQTCFAPDRLVPRIEEMEKLLAQADQLARAAARTPGPETGFVNSGLGRGAPPPKAFVTQRVASVIDQLDGKSEGIVSGRLTPGRDGPMALRRPGPAPRQAIAQAVLKGMDADNNRKLSPTEVADAIDAFFTTHDADKSGAMSDRELAAAFDRILPRFDPAVPPPATNPAQPPRRNGMFRMFAPPQRPIVPGTVLARMVMREADADGDEKLTREEMLSAARMVFKAADDDADGFLEDKNLDQIMERLLPQPLFPATQPALQPTTRPATMPVN